MGYSGARDCSNDAHDRVRQGALMKFGAVEEKVLTTRGSGG
jgi:hypothetical protein